MAIETFSKFYYGHTITQDNNKIDFNEGAGDLVGNLNVGNYSLTEYYVEVERALIAAGTLDYIVAVDRVTRQITISANANFSLLFATGANIATSASSLIGFDLTDVSGASTYLGANGSGSEYLPQFKLQKYVKFNHIIKSVQSKVNQSASGEIEVVNFGRVNLMKCNVVYITDSPQVLGAPIETNLTGVDDAISFLSYITTKAKIEFIENRDTPFDFTKCLCESTKASRAGVDFELQELLNIGLANYYQTGILTFRKVA